MSYVPILPALIVLWAVFQLPRLVQRDLASVVQLWAPRLERADRWLRLRYWWARAWVYLTAGAWAAIGLHYVYLVAAAMGWRVER